MVFGLVLVVTDLAVVLVGRAEPALDTRAVHRTHGAHAPTRGDERLLVIPLVTDAADGCVDTVTGRRQGVSVTGTCHTCNLGAC